MSGTVTNRRSRLRSSAAVLLTLLMLAPLSLLVTQVWQSTAGDRSTALAERRGVEYLNRLGSLVPLLAQGQSAALKGGRTAPPGLTEAMARVTEVDGRLGADLGTRERWAELRKRLDDLPTVTGGVLAVYQAHVQAADLLLALCNTVRGNSGLLRDPDNDVSRLQEAVAVHIPEAATQAGRMADLSVLLAAAGQQRPAGDPAPRQAAPGRQQEQQQRLLTPQLGAAAAGLDSAINRLTDTLQAAVDDTRSRTLSSNLIVPLDAFRRSIEIVTRGANLGGAPDQAALTAAIGQLRQTLEGLQGILLQEMDAMLRARLDDIDGNRRESLILGAGGAVLVLLLLVTLALGTGPRDAVPASDGGRSRGGDPRAVGLVPARPGSGLYAGPGLGDETTVSRGERTGVLR